MKIAIAVAAAAAILTGIPLLAQDSNTDANAGSPANDPAKVTYAPAAGGFGDLADSHAWEMSAVTGELEGKLDSKTAKVGDRVVLKTAEKAGIRPATRAGADRHCVRSCRAEERAKHRRSHADS